MTSAVAWEPGKIFGPDELTPDAIQAIKDALTPAQTMGLTAWAEARSRFEGGRWVTSRKREGGRWVISRRLQGGRWVANPLNAMVDICNVIDNRAQDKRWRTGGHKGVCLARWQFSCWEPRGGPDDPNDADLLAENFEVVMRRAQELIAGMMPLPKLASCVMVADSFIRRQHPMMLDRAICHYVAQWLSPLPKWARGRTPDVRRYGHMYFSNVR